MNARRIDEFCKEFEAEMSTKTVDEVIAEMCVNHSYDDDKI